MRKRDGDDFFFENLKVLFTLFFSSLAKIEANKKKTQNHSGCIRIPVFILSRKSFKIRS